MTETSTPAPGPGDPGGSASTEQATDALDAAPPWSGTPAERAT
jgi:hypothetical protein